MKTTVIFAALLLFASGCDQPSLGDSPTTGQPGPDITGIWTSTASDAQVHLRADGVFTSDQGELGRWFVEGRALVVLTPEQARVFTWELVEHDLLRLVEGSSSATYRRVPGRPTLVGCWSTTTSGGTYRLELREDGTCSYAGTKSDGNPIGYTCTWSAAGGAITIVDTLGAGATSTEPYAVADGQLVIGSTTWTAACGVVTAD